MPALWLQMVGWAARQRMTLWLRFIPTGHFHLPLRINVSANPCPTIMAGGMNTLGPAQHYLEDDGKDDDMLLRQTSGKMGKVVDLSAEPAPSVMAGGIDGHSHSQHVLVDGGQAAPASASKPPYRVPSMAEVAAVQWNGFTIASTFAGCGGSSLGYRMAGYRVVWANEFVPAAQACYRANMAAGTVLDGRDIKLVQPAEVLTAIGMREGELDLLDGSPPCQSFSTAGKRQRGWGQERAYEGGHSQRNEDLFWQFSRLLKGIRPRAFVAENVSGLVKGVAKGYFIEILAELKACGYDVRCRLLDAQWLGVPQQRGRVIFVGVRDDLGLPPAFPAPLPHRYSVRDACPWIGMVKSGPTGFGAGSLSSEEPAPTVPASMQAPYGAHEVTIGRRGHGFFPGETRPLDNPSATITSGTEYSGLIQAGTEKRKFTIQELKRICSFPDDFVLTGSYAQQWERLGNSVPPLMMRAVAEAVHDHVLLPAKKAVVRNSKSIRNASAKSRAASRRGSANAEASRGRNNPRPAPKARNGGRSRGSK